MTLLEVSGLVAGYRLGTVLHGVDLEVPERGAVAILGRNGVGKIDARARDHRAAAPACRERADRRAPSSPAAAPTCSRAPASRSCRRDGVCSRR